ncbi:glutathione-dependent disulfide-bond oxidoreductase [Halomonas cibimaris]|uniref:Glutathione-dependent disulfide-bond oxidoreductase n=1 Tax=Halomonas cibimaris TaxID=657012 RepID=A0ABP7LJ81_9GAMM
MHDTSYTLPRVWQWETDNGGKFAGTNRPTAGATHDKALPVGEHRFQLYSLATPNGVKASIMFEELLALGHDAEYDAWRIDIGEGEQFSSGFIEANPNAKIPALFDYGQAQPQRVFESGTILLYLAEQFDALLPRAVAPRTETLSWLFWQMGSAPFVGGGFGHFYAYAPEAMKYPIDRYTMETKRLLDVLNRRLAETRYLNGDAYSIADIASWAWFGQLALGRVYDAAEFLQTHDYQHVMRWARDIAERDAVKRGCMVNRAFGEPHEQLLERHSASDFEHKTQDKIG